MVGRSGKILLQNNMDCICVAFKRVTGIPFYNHSNYVDDSSSVSKVIQIIWFGMICRVAWRVLTTGSGASDDRSDEEG